MPPEFFIFPSGEVLRGAGRATGCSPAVNFEAWNDVLLPKYTFFPLFHLRHCFRGAPIPFSGLREPFVCNPLCVWTQSIYK